MESTRSEAILTGIEEKVHPWRLCPIGKHYVREHQEHIPPSKEHPNGEVIVRHAHCASNPLGKNKKEIHDILSFDEIQCIAATHFSGLKGSPNTNILKYSRADEFDQQILGWVQYWNAVIRPTELLDPNLVKALIASESGFNPDIINRNNPKKIGPARGLMQLTDETLRILGGQEDLKEHFIFLTHAEAFNPSANICAGVRWLFLKRAGAKARYTSIGLNDHAITWEDAVAEYKGVLSGILDKNNQHPDPEGKMPKFRSLYEKLKEQ